MQHMLCVWMSEVPAAAGRCRPLNRHLQPNPAYSVCLIRLFLIRSTLAKNLAASDGVGACAPPYGPSDLVVSVGHSYNLGAGWMDELVERCICYGARASGTSRCTATARNSRRAIICEGGEGAG